MPVQARYSARLGLVVLIGASMAALTALLALIQLLRTQTTRWEKAVHALAAVLALYGALLPALAERGFVRAYGVITLPNDASVALHATCGYESFATYKAAGQKFGRWHDVHWMRFALNAPRDGMAEPVFIGLRSESELEG